MGDTTSELLSDHYRRSLNARNGRTPPTPEKNKQATETPNSSVEPDCTLATFLNENTSERTGPLDKS